MKGNEYIENKSKNTEQAKPKKVRKKWLKLGGLSTNQKNTSALSDILSGDFVKKDFVVDNLPYTFTIIFLLILLVGKGYYVKDLAMDIKKTEEALGLITADYIEAKARLEEETKRTNLIHKLEPLGLKETVNPTKVIRIKEEE